MSVYYPKSSLESILKLNTSNALLRIMLIVKKKKKKKKKKRGMLTDAAAHSKYIIYSLLITHYSSPH
jgi:hypothetical protein